MRNCPICDCSEAVNSFPFLTVWNEKKFKYYKCINCKSTFIDPVPSELDFSKMYKKEAYHDTHYDECDYDLYANSLDWLLPRVPNNLKILDFGCGNGCFLKVAKERGFSCVGVELDNSVILSSSNYSGVVVKNMEQVMNDDCEYDIIHLGDVFEHLPDPQKTLKTLKKKLKKEGVFFVEGPLENNSSIVYLFIIFINMLKRYVGVDRPHTSAPTHLVRTNQKSQREFFLNKMQYVEIDFQLYENGWPYYHDDACPFNVGCYIKKIVGFSAILISKLSFFKKQYLGNRFYSLYRPEDTSK